MKNLKLFISIALMAMATSFSFAQVPDLAREMAAPDANFYDIQSRVNAYYKASGETGTGSGFKQFLRWQNFWEARVNKGNVAALTGKFTYADQAMYTYIVNPVCNSSVVVSDWKNLGPFSQPLPLTDQNMGIIISLYVDPVNHNNIFAGSNSSGLFKTTDLGSSWTIPDVSRLPSNCLKTHNNLLITFL